VDAGNPGILKPTRTAIRFLVFSIRENKKSLNGFSHLPVLLYFGIVPNAVDVFLIEDI